VSETAVEIVDLSVRFGEHLALDGISIDVQPGSFVAVIGPNGSGKSTLLKVLLGLVRPTAGRVHLFRRVPHEVPPEWIAYVPQVKTFDRSFPALSIELVATGIRHRWPGRLRARERAEALGALEQVGAAHLAFRPSGRLSGGELQRVYLARGLVRRPRIVILDEPATGIDVAAEADVYRLLDAYHREAGATVVMATHDLSAAHHHATHVLLLSQRQVAFGPPDVVLTEAHLRRAFSHVGHPHEVPAQVTGRA
jgi:zinc transport system ATP-binding protein